MYSEHFGLTQAPFKITPNTEFFFSGGNRGPVLEALIYAITRGEGMVKVTGEVGSGKTMLCNMLQDKLPEHVESVYLAHPSMAPEDVLHAIAFELQLGIPRDADRLEVMHALQDHLVKQHAAGKRVVVFIEESQSMPLATLEEIRLLSNLETRTDKLLQIVLFGQPELDEKLRRPDIRQLRDRIAHSFRLQPLTDAEVREYLMFRMRAAGYRGPDIFSGAVVKKIAATSSGLTRRINLIADKALLAAYAENTHTLQPRHVNAALRDTEFGRERRSWYTLPAFGWSALALVVGTALGAAAYSMFAGRAALAPTAHTSAIPNPGAEGKRASEQPQPALTPAVLTRGDGEASAVAPAVLPRAAEESLGAVSATERAQAPEPVAAVAAPGSTRDIVATRIHATEQWLGSAGEGTHSIQLLVAGDEHQLRKHLKALSKVIEVDHIYMYRSAAQGRPLLNVLWGSFPHSQVAQQELALLPASLRANRPYVRTVGGIRADIDRQRETGR